MDPRRFWKQFVGQRFANKYHLVELLGAGSFGGVFRADEVIADRVLRQVAIKLFAVEPDKLDQQLRELQLATTLKHPGLLDCYSPEQGMLDGELYLGLVMELAQGTLETRIKQGELAIAEVTQIAQTLATTLVFLHSRKIVHRDLKPANILRVHETVKIGDLGIARLLDLNRTSTLTSLQFGTREYMPPECYRGKIHPAWDIWSLGIILTELLVGSHPFPAMTDEERMMQVLMAEPQFQSRLPEPFARIIQGCLVKDNDQRWTAQQVVDQLQPVSRSTALIEAPMTPQIPDRSMGKPPTTPVVVPPAANIKKLVQNLFQAQPLETYQERLPNGVILEMVLLPGGSFMMGSDDSDSEKPPHQVQIPAFYLGKYPITQVQYQAVMGQNPSRFSFEGSNHPVERVSWKDAQTFCQTLSQLSGRPYRLPSEAQWEYACRAGSTGKYYFGEKEDQLETYAWYGEPWDQGATHPVGQKRPNAFGLFDMHGNVSEWCADDWHDSYAKKPEKLKQDGSIAWTASNSIRKLLRGGSWNHPAELCRSTTRDWYQPGGRGSVIGFRVCFSPQ